MYNADVLSYYDGEWVSNIRQGYGVRRYPSGNIYEGMWYKNRRHGLGTMNWFDRNQTYTGNWEDGIQVLTMTLLCSSLLVDMSACLSVCLSFM